MDIYRIYYFIDSFRGMVNEKNKSFDYLYSLILYINQLTLIIITFCTIDITLSKTEKILLENYMHFHTKIKFKVMTLKNNLSFTLCP